MTRYHTLPKARSLLGLLGWSYVGGMLVWFGLRLVFFDGSWWLALLNTVAFYLFLPVVMLLPLALWRRRWDLLFGLLAPCAMFAVLFSPLLLPFFKTPLLAGNGSSIKMMSFNAAIPFPVQRVDYIWHTNELSVVDASIGPDGGSDHLPLIAILRY